MRKKLGIILVVAGLTLLPVGHASAAGFDHPSTVSRGVVFARDGAADTTHVATPDGASSEYRSTKPNRDQFLKEYLESPKKAHHVVDASELLDEAANPAERAAASTPNPVSVTACRDKLGNPTDAPKYWYQDRFNSCVVTPVTIDNKTCDSTGNCRILGTLNFRLTLVGHGSDRTNPDGMNWPLTLKDHPGDRDFAEGEIALSTTDGIGLRSIWNNHLAHVTVRVHDSNEDAPPPPGVPMYVFEVEEPELTVMPVMGTPALIFPAPPPGRVAVRVECTGRDEAYRLLLVEHRENVADVERDLWPQRE